MYLERKEVCRMLSLSAWASRMAYNGLRPRRMNLISSRDVVALLNRASVGEAHVEDPDIPQLRTADEVSAETGIPARSLLLATRHRRNPCPHFRINKQTTRFRLSSVLQWIDGEERI